MNARLGLRDLIAKIKHAVLQVDQDKIVFDTSL